MGIYLSSLLLKKVSGIGFRVCFNSYIQKLFFQKKKEYIFYRTFDKNKPDTRYPKPETRHHPCLDRLHHYRPPLYFDPPYVSTQPVFCIFCAT